MYNYDYDWANAAAEKIYAKVKMSVRRSADKIPYLTEGGIFDDQSGRISWWTNGFYAGQLWQLYGGRHAGSHRAAEKGRNEIETAFYY